MSSASTSAAAKSTGASANKPGPKSKTDAQSLLKADHRKVEQIFAQYEQNEDEEQKRKLARQACLELIVHTKLEEELFYPACREKQVESEMMDEAQVEHDGAKILIADLLRGDPGDEYYDAKVKTLSEYIKHHVSEEERPRTGIFAKAQKAGVDMAGLGPKIQSRKMELMSQSEAFCSRPPQPRSIHLQPQPSQQSQEVSSMARNSNDRDRDERGRFTDDDDNRGSRGGYQSRSGRERDDQGRFMSEDDDRGGRGSSRGGGRGHGGWFGDSEGHSQASREGWEDRGSSRSRGYDDDDRGSSRSSRGGGRGQGGWFGDSEGHSEASRRGWEHSSHEGSGWYGDPRGHSEASRRGWEHSDHEGSGWYGDPQGHSQASREGWEDRGSSRSSRGRDYDDDRSSSRSSRGRDDDDDRSSRGGGRGHGGWFGDSQGHSQASREGWRDR